ncbi:WD40-repeat-containing domain protein [Schizophyllum fasciatum]
MCTTPPRPVKRTASSLTPTATSYVKRLRTTSGMLSRSQSMDGLPSASTSRNATPVPPAPAFFGKPSEAPRLLAGPDEGGLALIRKSLESSQSTCRTVIRRSASFYSASEISLDTEIDTFPTTRREYYDSQPPLVSEISARKFLQPTGVTFDYTPPSGHVDGSPIPLACTAADIVLFPRKNRIYGKNLTNSDAPLQLFKIPEKFGRLTMLSTATADHPHLFAASTTKNQIYIYNVNKPNEALTWFNAGAEVGAMAWNHNVLTVGDGKGRIRHYDTRIMPATRMKEQARKLMRHQSKVTALGYHRLGNKLASGDEAGNVFVWDIRAQQQTPMDVGEFVQRRKKIQHDAPISAISWSPYDSQTFCTGDTAGIVRRWDVTDNNARKSNTCYPRITDHKHRVDKIIFAPDGLDCREALSVHTGPALASDLDARRHEMPRVDRIDASDREHGPWGAPQDRPDTSNAVVVHTGNVRKYLGTVPISETPLGACALASMGRKIVFAVPEKGKIEVWTCWGRQRTEPRRTMPMMLR